jgi:hypothetical protein
LVECLLRLLAAAVRERDDASVLAGKPIERGGSVVVRLYLAEAAEDLFGLRDVQLELRERRL